MKVAINLLIPAGKAGTNCEGWLLTSQDAELDQD